MMVFGLLNTMKIILSGDYKFFFCFYMFLSLGVGNGRFQAKSCPSNKTVKFNLSIHFHPFGFWFLRVADSQVRSSRV
jgi:hypothetical protein